MLEISSAFLSFLIRGNLSEDEKERVREVYQTYGKTEITKLVKRKKIMPFAARTFCQCDIDYDEWNNVLKDYRERNQNIITFLDATYKMLHEHGVNKIFVSENFGALLSADEDIGLFTSGDIDNFSPITERDKIYKAMDALGCL